MPALWAWAERESYVPNCPMSAIASPGVHSYTPHSATTTAGAPGLNWVLLAVLSLTVGCSTQESAADANDTWVTDRDYEIGAVLEGDALFSWVPYLRVHEDHGVFVVEPREGQVSVWSPAGSLRYRVGRRGQGPGDLMFPYRLGFRPSGFWVRDNQRFTFFSYEGEFRETLPPPPTTVSYQGFRIRTEAILRSNSYLGVPQIPDHIEIGWGGTSFPEQPILRVYQAGDRWASDTLFWLDNHNKILALSDPNSEAGWSFFGAEPFAENDLYAIDLQREQIIIARRNLAPDVVRVYSISPSGDTLWRRSLELDPVPLTEERVANRVDELAANVLRVAQSTSPTRQPSRSTVKDWLRDSMFTSDHLPPVDALQVASTGEIWLRTWHESDTVRAWYSFPPDPSVPPREVLLPKWLGVLDATDTHVWGTRTDSLGVPHVVGRRLRHQ